MDLLWSARFDYCGLTVEFVTSHIEQDALLMLVATVVSSLFVREVGRARNWKMWKLWLVGRNVFGRNVFD